MGRQIYNRIALCLLAGALLLSGAPAVRGAESPAVSDGGAAETGVLTVSRGGYTLRLDTVDCTFMVEDRAGQRWDSSPVTAKTAGELSGAELSELCSMLVIRYIPDYGDGAHMSTETAYSYGDCVAYELAACRTIADGVRIDYYFEDAEIRIPVEIRLEDAGFRVSVCNDAITEEGDARLYSVALLPYLCAGDRTDEGYLFVPSGSGALVRFDTQNSDAPDFDAPVYGGDVTVDPAEPGERVAVPVYGCVRNGTALTAIVDEAAEWAHITARGQSDTTAYSRVGAEFYRCVADQMLLFEDDAANERSIDRFSRGNTDVTRFSVLCRIGDGARGYAGLAEQYRQYLLDTGELTKRASEPQLHLEMYGVITKPASFLGFPCNKRVALTTGRQAQTIVQALNEAGVSAVNTRLIGWTGNGVRNTRLPLSGKVLRTMAAPGEWKAFAAVAERGDNTLSLSVDLLNFSRSGGGFSVLNDSAVNLFNVRERHTARMPSDKLDNASVPTWYRLSSQRVPEAAQQLFSRLKELGQTAVTLEGLGNELYSDFSAGRYADRLQCRRNWQTVLRMLADSGDRVEMDGGNAYVYPYAQRIYGLAAQSDGSRLLDESVPFLQIVLHGYIPYTMPSGSRAADSAVYRLACLELGGDPLYQVMGGDPAALLGSAFTSLYSTGYAQQAEEMQACYAAYGAVYAALYDQTITDHRRMAEQVYCTVYESGTVVAVNYGSADASVVGYAVPAGGYAVWEGGLA